MSIKLGYRTSAATADLPRMLLELVVLGIVALLILRGWLFAWYVIPTGSMAPNLLGNHYERVCDHCGWKFAADGSSRMEQQPHICPNCDHALSPPESHQLVDGDRLMVLRNTFSRRQPGRWEVLAFRDPGHASQVFIKRVVGLPGESVRIIAGDVHVNGQIARKTLEEQRALAVPVHHANLHLPAAEQRWKSDPRDDGWAQSGGTIRYTPSTRHPDATLPETALHDAMFSWLTYHHGSRRAGIMDRYGYNQSQPILSTHAVDDLLFSCRVQASGDGDLALAVMKGVDHFAIRVQPSSGAVQLFRNGQPLTSASVAGDWQQERVLELSTMDQQILFAVDGVVCLELPYQSLPSAHPPANRPLAVGARELQLTISQLNLDRDVYYTPLPGRPGWGEIPYQLAADEFFVLGDNSPLSYDSRHWLENPAVPATMLVGKPVLVHWPSRASPFLGGLVRVPDFGKIRYIR